MATCPRRSRRPSFGGIRAGRFLGNPAQAQPGWEQFTALFLFFITENDQPDGRPDRARFAAKLPYEVQATTGAWGRLEARLAEICGWSSGRGP